MNKTIYDTYKNLNDVARNEVRHKFKDSPVVLEFIDFIEKKAIRTFKNREAVEILYQEELQQLPYAQLENRFFKLRKKILDELLPQPDQSEDFLAEEELELFRCKKMIQQNNKEIAYKRLTELEKTCFEKNIFEILPSIIDQIIFCNQSYNRFEQNKECFKKQEKAIELQNDINKTILLARKIYEINFTLGIRKATRELEEMRMLSLKHKKYPRFALCYQHVSLYYKMGSNDYLESTHVVSRHYKEFKLLMEAHPDMPIIVYRNHYSLYQQFHYNQITAFYHYNRGEFNEASEKMMEIWNSVQEHPKIFSIFLTESLYTNFVAALSAAGKHRESLDIINKYADFIKEAQTPDKTDFSFILKAQIWCWAHGEVKIGDIHFYLQKVEKYIKLTEKNNNRYINHSDANILGSKIYFMLKDYSMAHKILKELKKKNYTDSSGLLDHLIEFYRIASKPNDYNQLTQLKKELTKLKFNLKKPDEMIELNWMLKAIDNLKKN